MRKILVGLMLACLAMPAQAHDLEAQEVVVTGSRIEQDDYARDMPAVGLRRAADFLVQEVVISGDTRNAAQRRREIRAMLADAIRRAAGAGIELSYGDYILTRLTPER